MGELALPREWKMWNVDELKEKIEFEKNTAI